MAHRRSARSRERRRRWRRIALALPVLTTILLIAVVGGLIIVEQQSQVRTTEEADAVAQDFLAEVDAFRTDLTELIEAGREGPPAELKARIEARIAEPPTLPELTGEGADLSREYHDAQYVEAALLDPYTELVDVLGRTAVARDFIGAAGAALALRVEDLAGSTTIESTEVVEGQVIPAFEDALATFEAVPVPAGQEELAGQVASALRHVVDECRLLVSLASAGQSYSFSYGEQVAVAQEGVRLYGLTVDADLATAVDAALL
ncbi:MAG: hypothetical protein QM621_07600 [Aeromicrobium sp.]|uniref:hypothetical protein n=1 Tax=Aeromicrobium sp. TaxID=1871063 RepID=UPI0039E29E11